MSKRGMLGVVLGQVVTTTVIVGIGAILSVIYWGRGQQVPPELIRRRISLGDSLEEVEALFLGSAPLFDKSRDGSIVVAYLSKSGLGTFFTRQQTITLYFEDGRGLTAGIVAYKYQLGEAAEPLFVK